jgi:galactose mutarotase-like enzyme
MPLQHRETPYPHWEYQDPRSGDQLAVVPERGGLISGWICAGQQRLYLDQQRFADPSLSVRGGIPVLFPICGGLPGNCLRLNQGEFSLPQHGFARDLPWRLRPLAEDAGIALELVDSAATRLVYPFRFRLTLEARLAPRALEITAIVEHRAAAQPAAAAAAGEAAADLPAEGSAAESMPFSLGLHPYFAVSGLGDLRFEGLPPRCFDHQRMAEDDTQVQLARLGEGMDLLTRPEGAVRLWDADQGIELQTRHPWDLVVLWSEPPRPMVCLEPWTGPRQALLSGDRRLDLAAGEQLRLISRWVCLTASDAAQRA